MKVSTPTTQQQIARRLGVSQTLVSRALSGRAGEIGASAKTVDRIRKAARDWNYEPSATALALLGASTRTVGVVVKSFDDPYFGVLIGHLQSKARENGLTLLLTGGEDADLYGLRRHRVDGVILAGSDFCPRGLGDFISEGVPMVQIGSGKPVAGSVQTHLDEAKGICGLVDLLVSLGHRTIGFVAKRKASNQRRCSLLREELRCRGLRVRPDSFCILEGTSESAAEESVRQLLALSDVPTALVAAEDSIAIALLRALHESGKSVPEDLSIAGIDDIPMAASSIPPLTTLRQPVAGMVAVAFDALAGRLTPEHSLALEGEIVVRRSCAAPNH